LGCRVLVIEDDEALSALIAAWLNESGMTVTRAASVEAALYEIAWKNFEFDLLIADVHLPGTSGDQLVQRIRQSRPAMAAVVMSGGDTPPRLGERTVFLPKPFTSDELQSAIAVALAETRPAAGS